MAKPSRSISSSFSTHIQSGKLDFHTRPYLQKLRDLEHVFPPFKTFLAKIENIDAGRTQVQNHFSQEHNSVPGRCYGLDFSDTGITPLVERPNGFDGPDALRNYLTDNPAAASRRKKRCRLFILEDTDPDYMDVLGNNLGVDPYAFVEQMNTWNFTDSKSIPHRSLPSVLNPTETFTLRYYELRTLQVPDSIGRLSLQMTFAINRRKYEKWRDIDLPSFKTDNHDHSRHGFIRRCATFWTSQQPEDGEDTGWDAVLLVDPGLSSARDSSGNSLILKDPKEHQSRAALWNAYTWEKAENVHITPHNSVAYHDGCSTLAPHFFSNIDPAQVLVDKLKVKRDLNSPFDEQIFYWVSLASPELRAATIRNSSNCTFYLLKHVAQHWVNQLEIINATVAKGEFFSDDFQARIDKNITSRQWKAELVTINNINNDINYMRRQMNHFWRAIFLNLERLGMQLGSTQVDATLPLAIQGAQKDFLTVATRMEPLRHRVDALSAMANDLASLRASFKGIQDSDFGMRLSIFASIIFPLTLVASILSMGDDFLPGKREFWVFWVVSVPPALIFATILVYGRRLDRIWPDFKTFISSDKNVIMDPHLSLQTTNTPSSWRMRKLDSPASVSYV